ncbi:hypothetical protein [Streptomonospora litoralis]|uniref:Uncharacterized protein n=1 Tax=Streptomonospora litoralis TaxID=2498135 RepID=A0A4P6Q617_9ACTN|nr:hypothetical protein [Streptomonospora litoralis]QBI56113.1 hypothetical protein EKD16_21800 [Streptomonospora litoralis]
MIRPHAPAAAPQDMNTPGCPWWCRGRHPERSIRGQAWCIHQSTTYRGTHGTVALTVAVIGHERIDGRAPHTQPAAPYVELRMHAPAGSGAYTARITPAQARSLAEAVEAVPHGDPELAEGMRTAAHRAASTSEEES